METQAVYRMRLISITLVLNILIVGTKSANVDIISELTILKEQFLQRENFYEKKIAEMETRFYEAEERRISVEKFFGKKITELEEKLFENERGHKANEMNNDEKLHEDIATSYLDEEKLHYSEIATKLEVDSGMEPKDNRTDSNAAEFLTLGRVPHKIPMFQRKIEGKRLIASHESHRIAFSSLLSTTATELGKEQTIPFDQVLLNEGQSFDTVLHTFKCPVNGIYMFQSSLLCDYGDHIETEIVKLTRMYAAGDSGQHFGYDQGFNSAIIQCNKDERVWVRVREHSGNVVFASKFSTFSGFLLWEI